MFEYPSLVWVKGNLRNNLIKPLRLKVTRAFIVGSYANGTFDENSDLDIAVVIPRRIGISSMQFSEDYHSNFTSNEQKPKWNNKIVDLQFFYENDAELDEILTKIEIF